MSAHFQLQENNAGSDFLEEPPAKKVKVEGSNVVSEDPTRMNGVAAIKPELVNVLILVQMSRQLIVADF